jgi:hypothetical protein
MGTRAPLTYQQQWLWNMLKHFRSWDCMVTYAFRLSGPLDVQLIRSAVNEIIRRHGSLRTRVITEGGTSMQEIADPRSYDIPVIVIAGNDAKDVEANACRAVEQLNRPPDDGDAEGLLRIRLFELNEHEHWLALAMHRMIADCSSIDRVFREIWTHYEQSSAGSLPATLTTAAQYADYAIRQQQMDAEWKRKHEGYWKARLAGARPIAGPVAASTARGKSGAAGRANAHIDAALRSEILEFARRTRILAASVMFAVYAAVLWRWRQRDDFVVSFFVAGRQAEHKSIIGYFSHILYLRVQLSGSLTFTELLGSVEKEFFGALYHQDAGRMATQRPELVTSAFFQWMTSYPAEVAALSGPEAATSAERVTLKDFGEHLTALPPGLVDVEVSFFDTGESIDAFGVYRAELFPADGMDHFMKDLVSASEAFVRNPSASLAQVLCDSYGPVFAQK